MFDLCVGGGDIEVFGMNAKSLSLYRKERTFRRQRVLTSVTLILSTNHNLYLILI